MTTPQGLRCITANLHAQNIADNMNAVYWVSGHPDAGGTISHLRQNAWNELEKLAELFGAELVEIEPEQDEEPVDAETVAARGESYRREMRDAGRGHLLGGGS